MDFVKHEVEWTGEKVARIWDYYALSLSGQNQYFGEHSGAHVVRYLSKKVNFSKLGKILDFGCGPGDLMNHFLKYLKPGQELYGLDFSPDSIQRVRERFRNHPVVKEAIFTQQLPCNYPDNFFDLIISTETIEHLGDQELREMLTETQRLLKKGGFIVLTTPNDENLEAGKVLCPDCGCIFHKWQHVRTWNVESIKQEMQKYGFQEVITDTVYWTSELRKVFAFLKPLPLNGLIYIGRQV